MRRKFVIEQRYDPPVLKRQLRDLAIRSAHELGGILTIH
jgi:hypothetical protein